MFESIIPVVGESFLFVHLHENKKVLSVLTDVDLRPSALSNSVYVMNSHSGNTLGSVFSLAFREQVEEEFARLKALAKQGVRDEEFENLSRLFGVVSVTAQCYSTSILSYIFTSIVDDVEVTRLSALSLVKEKFTPEMLAFIEETKPDWIVMMDNAFPIDMPFFDELKAL